MHQPGIFFRYIKQSALSASNSLACLACLAESFSRIVAARKLEREQKKKSTINLLFQFVRGQNAEKALCTETLAA